MRRKEQVENRRGLAVSVMEVTTIVERGSGRVQLLTICSSISARIFLKQGDRQYDMMRRKVVLIGCLTVQSFAAFSECSPFAIHYLGDSTIFVYLRLLFTVC